MPLESFTITQIPPAGGGVTRHHIQAKSPSDALLRHEPELARQSIHEAKGTARSHLGPMLYVANPSSPAYG